MISTQLFAIDMKYGTKFAPPSLSLRVRYGKNNRENNIFIPKKKSLSLKKKKSDKFRRTFRDEIA